MPPLPQLFMLSSEVAFSASILPRTADGASRPTTLPQPLMLYALITASIFTILIIFAPISVMSCKRWDKPDYPLYHLRVESLSEGHGLLAGPSSGLSKGRKAPNPFRIGLRRCSRGVAQAR